MKRLDSGGERPPTCERFTTRGVARAQRFHRRAERQHGNRRQQQQPEGRRPVAAAPVRHRLALTVCRLTVCPPALSRAGSSIAGSRRRTTADLCRSEEHTTELQSLMRISYDVFCLKKKKTKYI